jgi:hypothetical protein
VPGPSWTELRGTGPVLPEHLGQPVRRRQESGPLRRPGSERRHRIRFHVLVLPERPPTDHPPGWPGFPQVPLPEPGRQAGPLRSGETASEARPWPVKAWPPCPPRCPRPWSRLPGPEEQLGLLRAGRPRRTRCCPGPAPSPGRPECWRPVHGHAATEQFRASRRERKRCPLPWRVRGRPERAAPRKAGESGPLPARPWWARCPDGPPLERSSRKSLPPELLPPESLQLRSLPPRSPQRSGLRGGAVHLRAARPPAVPPPERSAGGPFRAERAAPGSAGLKWFGLAWSGPEWSGSGGAVPRVLAMSWPVTPNGPESLRPWPGRMGRALAGRRQTAEPAWASGGAWELAWKAARLVSVLGVSALPVSEVRVSVLPVSGPLALEPVSGVWEQALTARGVAESGLVAAGPASPLPAGRGWPGRAES